MATYIITFDKKKTKREKKDKGTSACQTMQSFSRRTMSFIFLHDGLLSIKIELHHYSMNAKWANGSSASAIWRNLQASHLRYFHLTTIRNDKTLHLTFDETITQAYSINILWSIIIPTILTRHDKNRCNDWCSHNKKYYNWMTQNHGWIEGNRNDNCRSNGKMTRK